MTTRSITQRMAGLIRRLPETTRNSVRFRVPFLLPRWFRTPSHIQIGGRRVSIEAPPNEFAESDFIECFLLNAYGLGHGLGDVHSIVDIGANVGFFALAARGWYPNAKIHAYEPNPRVLRYLEMNTRGFNISVFAEAVGGEEGFVTILDEGPSDEARTRAATGDKSETAIRQIDLATAVERAGGTVDLLKLDCEGAEWEILRAEGCWRRIRHMRMEIHFFNGETLDEAKAAIARTGFRIVHLDEKNQEMAVIWASRD